MVTSLPTLPSPSSHSKKSTYIPRYDSTIHSSTSPSSPSSFGNNIQTVSLPTTSKNSRTRSHNHNNHVILPPPMVSYSSPPDSPVSSTGSSRSHSGKSNSSPSFHSMTSLTPSMASSSYTQKLARREKRHFQSSPSIYSSSTSPSSSGKSPSKKGGVTFSASQPSKPFMNRSAPASALTQPASTAKPKDRFLSRSPFTVLSSSPAKSPLAAAVPAAPNTPNSSSEKPTTKMALQSTSSTASNNSNGRIRASLRSRISTWASSVRQSFTVAHSQDLHSHSSSSPAPISPSTPTRVKNDPLPSESNSALSSILSASLSTQNLPIPTTIPVLLSSKEDLADLAMTGLMAPPLDASSKEAIHGTHTTNLATSTGNSVTPLLPLVSKTDKAEDEENMSRRHSHHLHPSALPFSTLSRSTTTTPKLVVQTTPPKYPAAVVRTTVQYTPGPASASGRSKPPNPFATPTTPIPVTALLALTTPTTVTTTRSNTHTFQSSLERARFLNQSQRRKVGSGLITVFCIAAIVILILC